MKKCSRALIMILVMSAALAGQTLKQVTAFDLPGPAGKRFDYLTIDYDDHYLLSAHLAAGQMYVIDTRTNRVVKTITNTPGVEGIEYVPGLKKVYTSNSGDNTIGVVDLQKMTVIKKLPTEAKPDGSAYAEPFRKLYVSDERGNVPEFLSPSFCRSFCPEFLSHSQPDEVLQMSRRMQAAFIESWLLLASAWMLCPLLSAASLGGQNAAQNDTLRSFLQGYVGAPTAETRTTRYTAAFGDLNGDGVKEAIVYLSGNGWCGSGGCVTLVLQREGQSYRVVTKITIARPPIRMLDRVSNGWHDIGVWVQGGEIQPVYEAQLAFDGKTYPTNPSVSPARSETGKVSGQVLISGSESAQPLFP
jgi:hypothetical protein